MPVNTKRAIAESFKKLLSSRELNKITVKDIVQDCGVNRQTFYYHFHDVYELMEWLFQDDADMLLSRQSDYADWNQALHALVEALQENHALISHAYHSMNHKVVANYIAGVIQPHILRTVETEAKAAGLAADKENEELVAEFLTLTAVSILTEWIDSGKRQIAEERLEKFLKAVRGSVPFMLRNLQDEGEAPGGG